MDVGAQRERSDKDVSVNTTNTIKKEALMLYDILNTNEVAHKAGKSLCNWLHEYKHTNK